MTISGVLTLVAVQPAPRREACDGVGVSPPAHERVIQALLHVRGQLVSICRAFRMEQDADDLIQRAAMLALEKGDTILNPESWMRGVVWRYCVAAARRRRRVIHCSMSEADEEGAGPAGLSCVDLERLREILAPHLWKLLWGIYAEGLTRREIADGLGYSLESIGKMKLRALAQARAALTWARPEGRQQRLARRGGAAGLERRPAPKPQSAQRGGSDRVLLISGVRVGGPGWKEHKARAARSEALKQLAGFGVSPRELARLDVSDVRFDSSHLLIRHGDYVEVLELDEGIVTELRKWCEIRGSSPGPLFVRLSKKGQDRRLTVKGVQTALARQPGCDGDQVPNVRKPAKVIREVRNLALVRLYEAGLEATMMSRLRVEDVSQEGVEIRGTMIPLPGPALSTLRKWMLLVNRPSGLVFVRLIGTRQGMTAVRIGQILAECSSLTKPRKRKQPIAGPRISELGGERYEATQRRRQALKELN